MLAILVVMLRSEARQLVQPPNASLGDIHRYTERYEGRLVQVSGTIRAFDDAGGRYYVLEDVAQNRALLRAPARQLADLVGSTVMVVGVVGFDETSGIYLDVDRIEGSPRPR